MNNNPTKTDVLIIGAGPVGLFGVFACGMLGLSCTVVDALQDIGGQCTALYPEKPIYDIPGFPQIPAGKLISNLEQQAAPFAPRYHLGHQIIELTQINDTKTFIATTDKGHKLEAQAVLIAAGGGAFGPQRPPLENISDFENKSVFYTVRDPATLTGKRIAIAGGGDSALDWANALADRAAHINVIHRRDQFRAAPASLARLEAHITQGRVTKITPYQLTEIHGENGVLSDVIVTDLDGHVRTLPTDCLLCFFGLSTNTGPLSTFGVQMEKNHILIHPGTGETSRPGIYAAGDIATYRHKLKLITTGFSEITQAAHAIYNQLHPDHPLHKTHSTDKGIPGLAPM